jgi:adenine deaminase
MSESESTGPDAFRDWVRALPKAELHLHIEGSLEPEMMFELSRRNDVTLPYSSVEEVRAAYQFTNLQSFLDLYYAGAAVLLKKEDFYDLAWAYFKRAKEDGLVHCELFFDPQTHTARGIAFGTVLTGLEDACRRAKDELGITSVLIMCFLRHLSEEEAFETLKQAEPFVKAKRIHGVGLDSGEKGNPPEKFERVFKEARGMCLRAVAHAGEEGPAEYITSALDVLKVERIDHGVRCEEDPSLMERLRREGIPLTCCPLSNLKLCVVKDLKDHNLRLLLQYGIKVTINSDDPSYFGGYCLENYLQTAASVGLTKEEVGQLARNSLEASWWEQVDGRKELKEKWLAKLGELTSTALPVYR